MSWILYSIYTLCVINIVLYSISLIHLLVINRTRKKVNRFKHFEEWPTVTVQLPIYNEYHVAEALIDCVVELDYPSDKLQIQVLDDSTDETLELVTRRVDHYKNLGFNIDLVHRDNRSGFKGGALRDATDLATGEFMAIFDADFRPTPDFLKTMLPYFDSDEVGCVQAKWGHINGFDNWFTKAQMMSMDVFFVEEQQARSKVDYYLRFNGAGGIWRKECVIDAGGWSGETLSEDLDLAYRAQMKGWKFRYDRDVECPAEIPKTLTDLKKQRYRWAYGKVQVIKKLLGSVIRTKMPLLKKIHAFFDLFNLASALAVNGIAFLSTPVMLLMLNDDSFQPYWKILFIGAIYTPVTIVMMYSSFNYYYKSSKKSIWELLKLFPFFSIIFVRITWEEAIAVFDQLRGKKVGFQRTPKYQLVKGLSNENFAKYFKNLSLKGVIAEFIFASYFVWAVYIDIVLPSFAFLPFHLLLLSGFVYSIIETIKYKKPKKAVKMKKVEKQEPVMA